MQRPAPHERAFSYFKSVLLIVIKFQTSWSPVLLDPPYHGQEKSMSRFCRPQFPAFAPGSAVVVEVWWIQGSDCYDLSWIVAWSDAFAVETIVQAGSLLLFLLRPEDGDEAVLWNNYELHQRLAKEAPQALYNVVQLLPLSACEMCWMFWQPWNTHSSFFELWSRHTFRLRPLIKLCSTSVSESMWLVLQESTVRELQKLLYSAHVVCTCRKPGSPWHIAQVGKSFRWLWPCRVHFGEVEFARTLQRMDRKCDQDSAYCAGSRFANSRTNTPVVL